MTRFVVPGTNDGYAILVVDESQDDRGIREILAAGGIGEIISESSQFVSVDDFGAFRQIPLVSFYDEIETFDPRNDGYAEKLSAFFANNGKRYFFTPLGSSPVDLRTRLDASLADIPFSLVFLEQRRSSLPYFLLLAAAGVFAMFLSRSKKLFIFQLPVFLSIGWGGFAAMILAAAFAGIWELLREPLKELLTSRYSRRSAFNYAGTGLKGAVERLRPYHLNIVLASLFFILLPVLAIGGFLPPVPLLAASGGFFLLYFLSFKVMETVFRNSRHIPFNPIPLLPLRTKTFSLFPFLLPFALGSFFALVLPAFLPGERSYIPVPENVMDPQYLVSPEDYYRHVDFQNSFSYRSMNTGNDAASGETLNPEGYLRYYLGDDGLIAGSAYSPNTVEAEALSFPLEKLMDFLIYYDKLQEEPAQKTEPLDPSVREWILAAIILTFCCMSGLLRPGIVPGKKLPVRWDKRIAA